MTFPRSVSQQVAEPGLESHWFLSPSVSMDHGEKGRKIDMLKTIYFINLGWKLLLFNVMGAWSRSLLGKASAEMVLHCASP